MIYAIICSRTTKPSKTLPKLLNYLIESGIKYHVSYDANSMFEGYQAGLDILSPGMEDIVIMCHDDIEILSDRTLFKKILEENLSNKNVGFIGPAGTTYLGSNAIWWDINRRTTGLHSGFVFQGDNYNTMTPNYFGSCRNVVVLDGLFLAARKETLDQISLKKPKEFPTNWDFYDLYYTLSAYEKGFTNKTVPIVILHNSNGYMRNTWEENRIAFCKMFRLPVGCK